MVSLKNQNANVNDETASSMRGKSQNNSISAKRPDLNEINKRNEEEAKQDRKLVYAVAGILILVISAVIVLVYFFS